MSYTEPRQNYSLDLAAKIWSNLEEGKSHFETIRLTRILLGYLTGHIDAPTEELFPAAPTPLPPAPATPSTYQRGRQPIAVACAEGGQFETMAAAAAWLQSQGATNATAGNLSRAITSGHLCHGIRFWRVANKSACSSPKPEPSSASSPETPATPPCTPTRRLTAAC